MEPSFFQQNTTAPPILAGPFLFSHSFIHQEKDHGFPDRRRRRSDRQARVQLWRRAQIIRRTGSSLNLAKEAYQPEEVRGDYQIQDVRHGSRKVQGDIEGELSLATYDSFIEATCRGTWTAGAGFTADAASGVTASAGARTFTRAGGSWLTDGFKAGDVVRWSGLSAGNDGRNLRVVGLTATVMTVAETVEAVAVADTDCSCAVAGRKVLTGTETRSFTIEQVLREAGFSQLFSGCRIGSM
ncbi:MAG: hypothetical protein K2Q10_14445, partial [Rhodospirillales bacterium]|nr:hypothetical protein [Rhodospirillales bacterium]